MNITIRKGDGYTHTIVVVFNITLSILAMDLNCIMYIFHFQHFLQRWVRANLNPISSTVIMVTHLGA